MRTKSHMQVLMCLKNFYFWQFECFSCQPAAQMLQNNGDLKRKWTWAVEWLNDELERVCESLTQCIGLDFLWAP